MNVKINADFFFTKIGISVAKKFQLHFSNFEKRHLKPDYFRHNSTLNI